MTAYWRLPARELRDLAAAGEVTVAAIVESCLERTAAVNGAVNAVVDTMAASARADAARLDEQRARGVPCGPLHGVPLTVKAEFDVAHSASTAGVVAYRDRVPDLDSPAVARLRGAGGVILGRTNEPDEGMRMHTECDLYGATLNPWDDAVTPGGSSGGDAVAVATGMVALGLGSDMGGSSRIPAYCCGVAGLKPSLGRVPRYGASEGVGIAEQMTCVAGPLARTVADLRLALRVLEGTDPRDPDAVPTPALAEPPLRGLRVAVAPPPPGEVWPPAVATALGAAAAALEAAGCTVAEVAPPRVEGVHETFLRLILADGVADLPDDTRYSAGVRAFFGFVRDSRPAYTPESLGLALAERFALAVEWGEFLSEYSLLVAPVWTCPPWPVGYDVSGRDEAMDVFWHDRFALCANLLGLPAVAVPTGVLDGLPTGVQVLGARFADDLCLSAAGEIERAADSITPLDPR
jgi:amidase